MDLVFAKIQKKVISRCHPDDYMCFEALHDLYELVYKHKELEGKNKGSPKFTNLIRLEMKLAKLLSFHQWERPATVHLAQLIPELRLGVGDFQAVFAAEDLQEAVGLLATLVLMAREDDVLGSDYLDNLLKNCLSMPTSKEHKSEEAVSE